jgi:hypothetical protein
VDFGFGAVTSSNPDIFLLKLSPAGAPIWCKQFGGTGLDVGNAVAIDSHDNVLITGYFGAYGSAVDFGFGGLTSAGGRDIFLAKYTSAGSPVWAKRFGGTSDDWGTSLSVDRRDDSVVMTGNFNGSVDFGGGALTSAGGRDIFLAKYSSTGAYAWAKSFGSTSNEDATGVAVDGSGNVVLVGDFVGTVNFGSGALTYNGVEDVFIADFNSAGTCQWSKNFGSSLPLGGDTFRAVDTDASGNIVVTGSIISSLDFGGGRLSNASGSGAVLVAKYASNGAYKWAKLYQGSYGNYGNTIATDNSGNVLVGGSFARSVDFGAGSMSTATDSGFAVKLAP